MRLIIAALVFAFVAASLHAEDLVITAGDGTAYTFKVPATVTAQMNKPPAGIPPTIKADAVKGKMSLQVTFMPKGGKVPKTQAEVNALVKQFGAAQYEGGSVEKATVVAPLKVVGGMGAIAQYTDIDLVNIAEPGPDKYKVVGEGVIVLGANLAVFTLLGDSFTAAEYLQGRALLEGGFVAK